MAATPGGLTASIRQKLQDGRDPEEIIQELVAGGLTQASATRFVDRAVADQASLPSLPDRPASRAASTSAPADSLDQFMQTKNAESAEVEEKAGRKPMMIGSLLMCGGIAVTAFSYIM